MTTPLDVRTISADEHRDWIASRPSVSFLQTPGWAAVKAEWRAESIGWFDGDRMVGAGLVLFRPVPKIERYLAYLPEGPDLDWTRIDLDAALAPMVAHLKAAKAFAIRMGPPVVSRAWNAAAIKAGVADPVLGTLSDVPADHSDAAALAVADGLAARSWRPVPVEGGFSAGQPKYNFQVPLTDADGAPLTEDAVLKGMNQLWRRNIKKAAKLGVEVSLGGRDDLDDFHRVYVETAERDHFIPRPASYFTTMWDALNADEPDRMRLYLARHEGDLVAATTMVRVGQHAWYSYGASTTAKREVRGSNAVQWRMIADSLAAGATVYDMRGITDTLDADDPHIGLIQFKVGTGGRAVEYLGEWDLPLNRALYKAFTLYLGRR
ncbi:MAG: peptidoglycan bridge formation glycyltransferase FemA/FemB family protein [Aeromicrobium sp.]|uniref:lipid II:glycine glycyltransferase FemX n=1 Tax=Aeromicrobium sp. TaxID=1871063 RepID=UPI0039E64C52